MDDHSIFRIYEMIGGGMFLNIEEGLIINFVFMHSGFPNDFSSTPKRLIFNSFPSNNLNKEIPAPPTIGKQKSVMVNAHHPEYAILFSILIDSTKRKVMVKLEELPEMGNSLITEEEKNGIQISY